ncbi:MAG: AAA family ATPase, partial [Candidatus Methylomirabilales bacterium]
MRPRSFDEVVGQEHLIGSGKALTALAESGELPSLVLWGPAGSGKTTLAHLLAASVGGEMVSLSAVSSGVADARKVMDRARGAMIATVLFVDEVHRWSKSQQDVLLPTVEDGTIRLIGATTENPFFSLVSPLLSRCLLLRVEPLSTEDLLIVLRRALVDTERGLGETRIEVDEDALTFLGESASGDARQALSALDRSVLAARSSEQARVTRSLAEDAMQRRVVVYDKDEHYDVVSAFIKSMRGSDHDAALFWLA